MWSPIQERVRHLASLDRRFQAFGAEAHRYAWRAPASASQLAEVEERLGARLPGELRSFYLEVADGGAGPDYGLLPVSKLIGFRANQPYPGIQALRDAAARHGSPSDESGYFEAPSECHAGLVGIIEQGCGHTIALVTTGTMTGRVVHLSGDGFVAETEDGLLGLYEGWLDSTIEQFEATRALMDAGTSFDDLQREMAARYDLHNVGDLITSIADVDKPASLFGTANARVYNGARQSPWFVEVLTSYQRARRKH